MATGTSNSSTLTVILGGAVVSLGAIAAFLFVNNPALPSAEQNTLAQAVGPLPSPARLPTKAQTADQMNPARLPDAQQAEQQVSDQQLPPPEFPPLQAESQEQRMKPAQPEVTRLPSAAAPNRDLPADHPCAGEMAGSDRCE